MLSHTPYQAILCTSNHFSWLVLYSGIAQLMIYFLIKGRRRKTGWQVQLFAKPELLEVVKIISMFFSPFLLTFHVFAPFFPQRVFTLLLPWFCNYVPWWNLGYILDLNGVQNECGMGWQKGAHLRQSRDKWR